MQDSFAILTDDAFIEQIILPSHYQLAQNNSSRFCIRNNQERILICSNDYANEMGFIDFKAAMFKRPGYEYERFMGTVEQFVMQMNYLNSTKKTFHYTYKNKIDSQFYTVITEPLFNLRGEVIGKKEIDIAIRAFSHRAIVDKHFKKYDIDVAAAENIMPDIKLTEHEEIILFMLIAGYTQQEIGEFMGVSRSYILKLISENLCPKLGLTIVSTKVLVDKAVAIGFASLIPKRFLSSRGQLQA